MSSTPKHIIFEEEAREELQAGIKELSKVLAFTLGPRGRNVGLENPGSSYYHKRWKHHRQRYYAQRSV